MIVSTFSEATIYCYSELTDRLIIADLVKNVKITFSFIVHLLSIVRLLYSLYKVHLHSPSLNGNEYLKCYQIFVDHVLLIILLLLY